ncbi:MAG: hypothetical protein HY347_12810 [candidate division NC10 bacterium]|nr:hypothetical protein [candidate division NC10 bacterium]
MAEISVIITGLDSGEAASLVKGKTVISPPAYTLFYPLYVFQFHGSLKRPVFHPREVNLFVVVDMARGGASLADAFPEVEPVVVEEAYLLQGTVTREEARGCALEKAKRRLSFRYPTWWAPEIGIAREALAYKRYWVFRDGMEGLRALWVVDSFTGMVHRLPFHI